MPRRLPLLARAACCSPPAPRGADDLTADLQARRARLLQALPADTMAIFWSAPERVYSRDVDYEYRQDSDLLYLTGVDAARHDPRADARQQDEAGDPVRPVARPEARALERAQPHAGGGDGAHRHRDGVPDAGVRARSWRRCSTATPFEAKTHVAAVDDDEYAAFFDAVADGTREDRRCGSAPAPGLTAAARRRARVRAAGPRPVPRRVVRERRAGGVRPAAGEDAVRAGRAATGASTISTEAHIAGMRAARPGRVRVRGRGGHRARVPRQRRDVAGLPVDRRQRARTRRCCTTSASNRQDGGRRPAARGRGRELPAA